MKGIIINRVLGFLSYISIVPTINNAIQAAIDKTMQIAKITLSMMYKIFSFIYYCINKYSNICKKLKLYDY